MAMFPEGTRRAKGLRKKHELRLPRPASPRVGRATGWGVVKVGSRPGRPRLRPLPRIPSRRRRLLVAALGRKNMSVAAPELAPGAGPRRRGAARPAREVRPLRSGRPRPLDRGRQAGAEVTPADTGSVGDERQPARLSRTGESCPERCCRRPRSEGRRGEADAILPGEDVLRLAVKKPRPKGLAPWTPRRRTRERRSRYSAGV
jgi:hypothetical protein